MASPLPTRLDSLTGLRFFAAWMVVAHHFSNFATIPFVVRYQGFGATGVSFFFVLSGFVLTWSFVKADTAPRFYWRRFARIWPLHAVTTLLALPVFYSMRDVPYDWTAIFLSFALLHAWFPAASTYFAGNPASWSLSCEMFFYALHPLVVRKTLALKGLALSFAVVAVLAALFITTKWSPSWFSLRIVGWLLYISPVFRIGEFLLGMGLAAAMKRGFRVPIGVIPAALLIAGWFHLEYQLAPDFPAWLATLTGQSTYVALPVLYALLIGAAAGLDLDAARSWLRSKPMVWLGQWSFALYLVHATIIYAMIDWIGVRPYGAFNVLWFVAVSAIAIATSAGLYKFIEHPIEQWLRSLQKRPQAAPQAAPELAGATGQ